MSSLVSLWTPPRSCGIEYRGSGQTGESALVGRQSGQKAGYSQSPSGQTLRHIVREVVYRFRHTYGKKFGSRLRKDGVSYV
jgi:hypothetical protein